MLIYDELGNVNLIGYRGVFSIQMVEKTKKIILLLLLFGWSAGLGLRFIILYFQPFLYYQPNTFDLLFDWTGLFLLAVVNAVIFFKDYYKKRVIGGRNDGTAPF
jgi:hypothetical protein